jgi:alkylhydroperoxidase family enzyme
MSEGDPGASEGGGLAAILAVAPEVHDDLERLRSLATSAFDPVVVELCQHHLAMFIGADPEPTAAAELPGVREKLENLSSWPTSPLFSATERACLSLTEQFVIDVSSITDDDVATVSAHLGPDNLYGLILALQVFDGRHRLRASLAAVLDDSYEKEA